MAPTVKGPTPEAWALEAAKRQGPTPGTHDGPCLVYGPGPRTDFGPCDCAACARTRARALGPAQPIQADTQEAQPCQPVRLAEAVHGPCVIAWDGDHSPCGAPAVGVAVYGTKLIPNAWGGTQASPKQSFPCCASHGARILRTGPDAENLEAHGWSFRGNPLPSQADMPAQDPALRAGMARSFKAGAALARLMADPSQADRLGALDAQTPTEACRALKQAIRAGLVDAFSQPVRDLVAVALDRAELDASVQLERAARLAGMAGRDLASTWRKQARQSAQDARQAADQAAGALGAAEALHAALGLATGAEL